MDLTAAAFSAEILAAQSDTEREKYKRYFPDTVGDPGVGEYFAGVRMGTIFTMAKTYVELPPDEIETMLESPVHEIRVGACKVMALQAGHKRTTHIRRGELFALYLRRHDRINDWDLVDLAAAFVVGGWLEDKPRDPLYRLAESGILWERRSAIVATARFLKAGAMDDTYAISAVLLNDPEPLVQKATAWMLRYAGDVDNSRLFAFLDRHAATMPRVTLRGTIEKLPADQRKHYLALGRQQR